MRLITRAQPRWVFSTLLILSIVSFAVPHASQDDASDEFILFVSDRAFPSQAGICASTAVPTRITFSEDPGFSGFPSWGKWGTE